MAKLDTSKTTWDLSLLLSGPDDPKIKEYRDNIAKTVDTFAGKWRGRTDHLEKPEILTEALGELEAIDCLPGDTYEEYYFSLRASTDSTDTLVKAGLSKAEEFARDLQTKIQFFILSVATIPRDRQPRFVQHSGTAPYKHFLERIFATADYRLSEPEEKILLLKSGVSHGNWAKMVDDLVSQEQRPVLTEKGKSENQTFEQIATLISNRNKDVRDSAAEALNDILSKRLEIAEVEFNSILENKKIDDHLRGYCRPDEARLLADDMEVAAVDAMIEVVSRHYEVARRIYRFKAKLFGVPQFAYHERRLEYGRVDAKYSYDQAVALVHDVFAELDPQFGQIFKRFVESGKFDVYPKSGKRGGAFCAGNHSLGVPTYILLNYTNKLYDIIVMAHEAGHGINNELMKKKVNALNCSTPVSTAEVASTFMEDFVLERLLQEADEEMQLAIMVRQLDSAVATIFRQVSFYKFEQEVHQQFRAAGYLSGEQIGKLFQKHTAAYMGPAVEQSPGSQNWWLYVPHFRTCFYVYSYASGLLIAKSLQAKVRQDKRFIEKVKVFLSAGTSKSPKDIFAEMGIDITNKNFWEQGIAEIQQLLDDTEALAKKLGKI